MLKFAFILQASLIFVFGFQAHVAHAEEANALVGKWIQECQGGKLKLEDFSSNQDVTLVETYHSKANCETEVMSVRSIGTYVLDAAKIDFTFSAVVVRLTSTSLAEKYSSLETCGIKQWTTEKDIEITGKKCDLFGFGKTYQVPFKGEVRYGIYGIYEDLLFFGALSKQYDATTPEKRPIYLDNRGYRKIKP